ncbi:hypothetical protein ACFQZ4_27540 [Catellatospora coxensis]
MGAADEPTQNLPEFKPGRSRPTEPLPRQRPDDEEHEPVAPPRRSGFGRALLTLVVVLGLLAGATSASPRPGCSRSGPTRSRSARPTTPSRRCCCRSRT